METCHKQNKLSKERERSQIEHKETISNDNSNNNNNSERISNNNNNHNNKHNEIEQKDTNLIRL